MAGLEEPTALYVNLQGADTSLKENGAESPSLPPRDGTPSSSIFVSLNLRPMNLYPYPTPDPKIHGEGPFVAALPPKDRAPADCKLCVDQLPMWHPDSSKVGSLYETDSIFVKQRKGGSISLVYEQQLRQRGIHGYAFTVLEGSISAADGVGFVFASKLKKRNLRCVRLGRVPCSKNIKRLWSVFVNRNGKISKRMGDTLIRAETPELPPFAVGQVLSMVVDLNLYKAAFEVRHEHMVLGRSHIDLTDMAELVDASAGYFCAAVTKAGMVVRLSTAPTSLLSLPEIKPYHTTVCGSVNRAAQSLSYDLDYPALPHNFLMRGNTAEEPSSNAWQSDTVKTSTNDFHQQFPVTYTSPPQEQKTLNPLAPIFGPRLNLDSRSPTLSWIGVSSIPDDSNIPMLKDSRFSDNTGEYVDPLPLFRSGKTTISTFERDEVDNHIGSGHITGKVGIEERIINSSNEITNTENISKRNALLRFHDIHSHSVTSIPSEKSFGITSETSSQKGELLWSRHLDEDPILTVSNRALSTNSNSSAFVGAGPEMPWNANDAAVWLREMSNFYPFDHLETRKDLSGNNKNNGQNLSSSDEDEESDVVNAMLHIVSNTDESLLRENRTMSAPPAPNSMLL